MRNIHQLGLNRKESYHFYDNQPWALQGSATIWLQSGDMIWSEIVGKAKAFSLIRVTPTYHWFEIEQLQTSEPSTNLTEHSLSNPRRRFLSWENMHFS